MGYFLAKTSREEKTLLGLSRIANCWTYSVTGANRDKKYYIGKLPLKESAVKLGGKPADELDVTIFKSAEQIRQDFAADQPRNGMLEAPKTAAERHKHRHKRLKKHHKKRGHKKHGPRHQKYPTLSEARADLAGLLLS